LPAPAGYVVVDVDAAHASAPALNHGRTSSDSLPCQQNIKRSGPDGRGRS
jgi:hypothetical protein